MIENIIRTILELKGHVLSSGTMLTPYVESITSDVVDELKELERLATIGQAAEKAFEIFSMGTVDENGKENFVFLNVEDMLEWAESKGK